METIILNSIVPESIGEYNFDGNKEYMQYLYLPIKMEDSFKIELEPRLEFLETMIANALDNECTRQQYPLDWFKKQFVYLTIKQTLVPKGLDQNRPGWHSDGFGSNDVQYIFFDKWPTEFMIGDFDVPNDDTASMEAFEMFGRIIENPNGGWYRGGVKKHFHQPTPGHLYRIDQNNIHRTIQAPENGVRLFIKMTISEHKYAQEGNSRNYQLKYDWPMAPRKLDRNQPHEK